MPMTYKQAAQSTRPPLIAGNNSFLGDVIHSAPGDKQLSAGFYRQEKGQELVYAYHYDEMKIILEGTFNVKDETGVSVTGKPGDVLFFPKGTTITFSSPDYGLAYYVGLRAADSA